MDGWSGVEGVETGDLIVHEGVLVLWHEKVLLDVVRDLIYCPVESWHGDDTGLHPVRQLLGRHFLKGGGWLGTSGKAEAKCGERRGW